MAEKGEKGIVESKDADVQGSGDTKGSAESNPSNQRPQPAIKKIRRNRKKGKKRDRKNCKGCVVGPKTIPTGARFRYKTKCKHFTFCRCNCDGTWKCRRERNLCKKTGDLQSDQPHPSTTYARFGDRYEKPLYNVGEGYRGPSKVYSLTLEKEFSIDTVNGHKSDEVSKSTKSSDISDSLSSSFLSSSVKEISSLEAKGCNKCVFDGQEIPALTQRLRGNGCVMHICKCDCNGNVDCNSPAMNMCDAPAPVPLNRLPGCRAGNSPHITTVSLDQRGCRKLNCLCKEGSWSCRKARNPERRC